MRDDDVEAAATNAVDLFPFTPTGYAIFAVVLILVGLLLSGCHLEYDAFKKAAPNPGVETARILAGIIEAQRPSPAPTPVPTPTPWPAGEQLICHATASGSYACEPVPVPSPR